MTKGDWVTGGRDGKSSVLPRRSFLGLGMAGMLGGLLFFPPRRVLANPGKGGVGFPGREIRVFLQNRDELKLSREQVLRLREIQDAAQKSAKDLAQQVRRLEKRISEEMGEDAIDLTRIGTLAEKIGKIETEIRLESARALRKAKATLTEEQLRKARGLKRRPGTGRRESPLEEEGRI